MSTLPSLTAFPSHGISNSKQVDREKLHSIALLEYFIRGICEDPEILSLQVVLL